MENNDLKNGDEYARHLPAEQCKNVPYINNRCEDEQVQASTNHLACESNPKKRCKSEEAEERGILQIRVPLPSSERSLSLESMIIKDWGYPTKAPALQKEKQVPIPANTKPLEKHAWQKLLNQPIPQCLNDMSREEILKFWLGDSIVAKDTSNEKGIKKIRRLRKKKKKKEERIVHSRKWKTSNSSEEAASVEKPNFRNGEVKRCCKRILCPSINKSPRTRKSRLLHEKGRNERSRSSSRSSVSSYSSARSSHSFETQDQRQDSHSPKNESTENSKGVSDLTTSNQCVPEVGVLNENKSSPSLEKQCYYSETYMDSCRNRRPDTPFRCPTPWYLFRESVFEKRNERYGIRARTGEKGRRKNLGESKDQVSSEAKRNCKYSEDKGFSLRESSMRTHAECGNQSPYIINMQTVLRNEMFGSLSEVSFRTAMTYPASGSSYSSSFASPEMNPAVEEKICVPFRGRKCRRCYSLNEIDLRSFKTKEFIKAMKEMSFSDDSYFLRYCRSMSPNTITASSSLSPIPGSLVDILCSELPFNLTTEHFNGSNHKSCSSTPDTQAADERFFPKIEKIKLVDFLRLKPIESKPFANEADLGETLFPPKDCDGLKSKSLDEKSFADISFSQIDEDVFSFNIDEQGNPESEVVAPHKIGHVSNISTETQPSASIYQSECYCSKDVSNSNVMLFHDPRSDTFPGSACSGVMLSDNDKNLKMTNSDRAQSKRLHKNDTNMSLPHFCQRLMADYSLLNTFTSSLNKMPEWPAGGFLNIQPSLLPKSELDSSSTLRQVEGNNFDTAVTLAELNSTASTTLDSQCKVSETAALHFAKADVPTVTDSFEDPSHSNAIFIKASETEPLFEDLKNPFLEQNSSELDPSWNFSSGTAQCVPIETSNAKHSKYFESSVNSADAVLTNKNGPEWEHDHTVDSYWQQLVSLAPQDVKRFLSTTVAVQNTENMNNQYWRKDVATCDYDVITTEYEHEYEDVTDLSPRSPFAISSQCSKSANTPDCPSGKIQNVSATYCPKKEAANSYQNVANHHKYEYLDDLSGQNLFEPNIPSLDCSTNFRWSNIPLSTSRRPDDVGTWRSVSLDMISNDISETTCEDVSDLMMSMEDPLGDMVSGTKSPIQVEARNHKGTSVFRWKKFFTCSCCKRRNVKD